MFRWILAPLAVATAVAITAAGCGAPGTESSRPAALATPIPIKHVVVIVKENHTFDNYFGSFPNAEGTSRCLTSTGSIPCPRAPLRTPRDLCHDHGCALTDWALGAMTGWDKVSGSSSNGDNLAW